MSNDDHERQDGPAGAEPPATDLPAELQEQIVDFARTLPVASHYVALGVPRGATPAQIRDAFRERSQSFHPDRYFGRTLGGFEPLLHQIYKRVLVAHEVLRDPAARERYDRSLAPEAGPSPQGPESRSLEQTSTVTGSLRGRVRKLGRSVLADLRARVAGRRSAEGSGTAGVADRDAERGRREAGRVLAALIEAAELRPDDSEFACQAAERLLDTGRDLEWARHFAERAVELEGDCARYHKTMGRVHSAAGRQQEARNALRRALDLDPDDPELTKALEEL